MSQFDDLREAADDILRLVIMVGPILLAIAGIVTDFLTASIDVRDLIE